MWGAGAAHRQKVVVSDQTRRAYETSFGHFRRWADERGLPAMPPDVPTVAVYLEALADGNVEVQWTDRNGLSRTSKKPYKYDSIQRVYMSIIQTVRAAGHEWPHAVPAITKVMYGIRYRKGSKKKRMAPLEIADLRACLAKMRERRFEDLTVIRDRALLSLGFFSACRRAELVCAPR